MPKAKSTKTKNGSKTKQKPQRKSKGTGANETPAAPKKPRRAKDRSAKLDALRAKAAEAKEALAAATNEANALRLQGMGIEAAAKRTYIEALGPYREACRKAGVECELGGARAANKTPAVRFLVEKVAGGDGATGVGSASGSFGTLRFFADFFATRGVADFFIFFSGPAFFAMAFSPRPQ